jgi:hypothetical protein
MEVSMNYWQIMAGSDDRDYTKYFLKYGIAFLHEEICKENVKKVCKDDIVVLKWGTSGISAVGRVVEHPLGSGNVSGIAGRESEQHWLLDFAGWELRRYFFVDWHRPPEIIKNVHGLGRRTLESVRIENEELRQLANMLLAEHPAEDYQSRGPATTRRLEDKEIREFLVSQGLGGRATEEFTQVTGKIRTLAKYYEEYRPKTVLEHETRAFLIVPLLLALGWAEQQIRIEWTLPKGDRVDLALFSRGFEDENNRCLVILESKDFKRGLDSAAEQVLRYANSNELPCNVVIASNGYCYKTFERIEGKFPDSVSPEASGYMNLLDPRDMFPLDPQKEEGDHLGNGALKVLKSLLPVTYVATV